MLGSGAFVSELVSEVFAADLLDLVRPVWTTVGLILAPCCGWWAELWQLFWVIGEESTALRLGLDLS